ncbi:MAG: hypothetical protein EOO85_09155 [Pedobacter sp.]|nr:MAG: hypothetical protein EOO85_09155 [Pedobacter sp.]
MEDKEVFLSIEKFINQPDSSQNKDLSVENTLSYVIVFLVNFLSGNLEDNIRMFKKINEIHHNVFLKRNSIAIYVLNICFINGLRLDSNFNSGRIVNLVERLQENKKNELPDYLNVLFLLVRAEYCAVNEDYEKALNYATNCMDISKDKNISFLRVLLYVIISNIYDKMEEPESARDIRYKLHCLLEEKKIDLKSFLHNSQYMKTLS